MFIPSVMMAALLPAVARVRFIPRIPRSVNRTGVDPVVKLRKNRDRTRTNQAVSSNRPYHHGRKHKKEIKIPQYIIHNTK